MTSTEVWSLPKVVGALFLRPNIQDAIESYKAARAINKDAGIVNRVLRSFDALAVADDKGILSGVREAAGGNIEQGRSQDS